ncbi:hypothetical protein BRM24_07050, partial [Xanthomonas oryzae pv. oryzae]
MIFMGVTSSVRSVRGHWRRTRCPGVVMQRTRADTLKCPTSFCESCPMCGIVGAIAGRDVVPV